MLLNLLKVKVLLKNFFKIYMTPSDGSIMLILSSPSGAGKTTITKKIQQKYQNFKISVSHTTRKPRSNEVEGVDYFFVSHENFKKKISNNEFYEYAKIFDNFYGTSRNSVNVLLKNYNNVLFDIDWQGTQQLLKFKELKLIKIFLLPPDKKELKNRLIQRNQDNIDIISKRLKAYDDDVHHWSDYDHVIINDNLEHCFSQIEKIIKSAKNNSI
jgi:guanylate kinase